MDYIVVDLETTKVPKHKPWMEGAYLCSIGILPKGGEPKV